MRHYNRSRHADLFAQNFLWMGYYAWQGYLNGDRGSIVIGSDVDLMDDADYVWTGSAQPNLNFRYVPQPQLTWYLQEWLVSTNSIESILSAVANYRPETELVFALEFGKTLDIGWCQRLNISPPDCYQQICQRWSEFDLGIRL
jgi:hypothetical protein